MDISEDIEKWVWLQQAMGAGSARPAALSKYFGSISGIYHADYTDYRESQVVTDKEAAKLCDKSLEQSRHIISRCMEKGYNMITMDSDDYPKRLEGIYAPPCVLYTWGDITVEKDRLCIGMVGKRQATEYGIKAATSISMGLVRYGAVIVSGMAVGIDGFSHQGALKASGETIAVLGCGIDIDYPANHVELKRLIAYHGAVISEYPPGTRADRLNFPIRNRIIAGLSDGLVVVEAGRKSGSLITADIASNMGREMFAVPGSIFSPASEGCNALIQEGAMPACSILDILHGFEGKIRIPQDEVQPADRADTAGNTAERYTLKKPSEESTAGLNEKELMVYHQLNDSPVHVDSIALAANLPLPSVLAALTTLELQGMARSYPGRTYSRA